MHLKFMKRIFIELTLTLLVFVFFQPSYSQEVNMVADINVHGQNNSGSPLNFTRYKDKIIFQAHHHKFGTEIFEYINDTTLIFADINPGTANSDPSSFYVVGDSIFFSAKDNSGAGHELWLYNGIDSPYLIYDLDHDVDGSRPTNFLFYNQKLYFSAYVERGHELFELDLVQDSLVQIDSDQGGAYAKINYLTLFNQELYYLANDAQDLIKYDFNQKPQIVPTSKALVNYGYTSSLTVFENKLCFLKKQNNIDVLCYKQADIDSIFEYVELTGGLTSDRPYELFGVDSVLFIGTYDESDMKKAIWKYDSNFDLVKISIPDYGTNNESFAFELVGNDLYFKANQTTVYKYNLDSGTSSKVIDLFENTVTDFKNFLVLNDSIILLNATDSLMGYELFKSRNNIIDLVAEINTKSNSSSPYFFHTLKDKLLFSANDGTHGYELWEYDGISDPKLVFDINEGIGSGLNNGYSLVFNNKYYISAYHELYGHEIWCYDGINNPYLVKDLIPGVGGHDIWEFFEFRGELYFDYDDGVHGTELWKMNKDEEISLAFDLNIGDSNSSSSPKYFTQFENKLAFFANTQGKKNIFLYDGINPPVKAVSNCEPTCENQQRGLYEYNGNLFFKAYHRDSGVELWKYDGENATELVIDINPGDNSSSPYYFTEFQGDLYFSAGFNESTYRYNEQSGLSNMSEEWDGNLTGCVVFKVIHDKLYFRANGPSGKEMYEYSGDGNPKLVADINPTGDSEALPFHGFNNKIYFSANDGEHGKELWEYNPFDCSNVVRINTSLCHKSTYTSPTGKYVWDTTGFYYDTVAVQGLCDTLFLIDLTIGDKEPPVMDYLDTLTYYLNDSCFFKIDSLNQLIKASDNCSSGNLNFNQNLIGMIDYSTFKNEGIIISAADSNDNQAIERVSIKVLDTIRPVIDLIPSREVQMTSDSCFYMLTDFRDSLNVMDNCGDSLVIQQIPSHNTVYSDTGMFFVKFVAHDQFFNVSDTGLMALHVKPSKKEIFCGESIQINLNGSCIYLVPDFSGNFNYEGFCSSKVEIRQNPEPETTLHITDTILPITFTITNAMNESLACSFDINFLNLNSVNIDTTVCPSFSIGNNIWNDHGAYSYQENLQNVCGQDSIVKWQINIDNIDTVINVIDEFIAVSWHEDYTYNWVRCDENDILEKSHNYYYKPIQNGNYAVFINTGLCEAKSECLKYRADAFYEIDLKNHVLVYPNPFTSKFKVNLTIFYKEIEVKIYNISGILIDSKTMYNVKELDYNLNLAKGMYFLKVKAENEEEIFKISKH